MSIDRSIDKEDVVYRYTIECYSAIKENGIMPFFWWQNGQIYIDYHIKWSQAKTNIIWYNLYVESKIRYKWPYLKSRHDRHRKQTYGYQRGKWREKWADPNYYIYKANCLYSTGNCIQYLVLNCNGKNMKRNSYLSESPGYKRK